MIVVNPSVDDLLRHFPNLQEALTILVKGLQNKEDQRKVLYKFDKFRREEFDNMLKGK